jgi:hypothetical protein
VTHFKIDDEAYWRMPEGLERLGSLPTLRLSCFVLGDQSDDAPTALVLKAEPGHIISHHCHTCERFEVIVKGTLLVGDEVLGPGDVMVARPGEFYGPHVAGPDGCTTVEFFGNFSDAFTPVYKDGAGGYLRADPDRGERVRFDLDQAIAAPRTTPRGID